MNKAAFGLITLLIALGFIQLAHGQSTTQEFVHLRPAGEVSPPSADVERAKPPAFTVTNSPAVALTFTNLNPNSFSSSLVGYQPTMNATGTNFTNVIRATFNWSGVTSGNVVWNKGDTNWNGKVVVNSDSSMTLRPVLTQAGDPAGITNWTLTLTDSSGAAKAQAFTVTYSPTVALTFTNLNPNSFSSSLVGYQPTMNATGTNFTNVIRATFNWSGVTSGNVVWNKGDTNWNGKVVVNSDSSMTLRPVLTQAGDPAGITNWTLTLTDSLGAAKAQAFTVTYSPTVALTFTDLNPNSFNTSLVGYQPTINTTGTNFTNVNQVTLTQTGATNGGPFIWNKGDFNWNNKVTISSDTSMTLRPVLTGTGDASGLSTWTLTLKDSNASTKSRSFTLNYTPAAAPSLFVSPGSGPLGTAFTFAAVGYTRGGTATLTAKKPNGQISGTAKYSVNTDGNLSFVITSQPNDPAGQWTFLLKDDTTGSQANPVQVQYSSAQPGADMMYYSAATLDVSIPDNTQFAPGETHPKVWHLQNSGTNPWSNYRLVFVSGTNLSSVSFITINAAPGQWIDTPALFVTAPATPGTYYSYWQLQNSNGALFGDQVHLRIRVVQAQAKTLAFGAQCGVGGPNGAPATKSGCSTDPVNTATGNYNYATTDLRVAGRGLDVELSHSYNAQDARVGPLGAGWSHSFNIYLSNITSSGVSVHYSDGKVLDYLSQSGSTSFFSSYPGYYDTLLKNVDGTWTLSQGDQKSFQFDSAGRLTSIQDRNSNRIIISYVAGNPTQITDTVGRTFNLTYSGSLLTRITDPVGRTLQFSYDGNSNLSQFRDANSNTVTYVYDENNRLSKVVDSRGNNLVVNTYDGNSRVINQTNGRGNSWSFTYNSDNSTTVIDPFGNPTKYLQDTNFNLQQTVNRNTNLSNFSYDERNNRVQISDLNGNYASYVYDQNGNITSQTDPILNLRQSIYDERNNPTQVTDEMNENTRMTYDSRGNLTSVTDALNRSVRTGYDSSGQPVTLTDANGNVTTRTYDAQANLITLKDALNNVTSYTYDAVGRRLSMTDARGKTTRYTYDNNDNLLTVSDPMGNTTVYTYDANNNRISRRDPRGNTTTYTFDEDNNLTKETDAKGNFVQHTYDALDRLVSTRDKRGKVTGFTYDNEGRLVTSTDPMTNKTNYSYDANGNRIQVTDARNQVTRLTYDALNRVVQMQDPLTNTTRKEYDPAGRLSKHIDPNGNSTVFRYDAVGNLIQVTDASLGSAKYAYDANRNRISQTDPNNHASSLAYDKLNRLLTMTDPLNQSTSYAYDEVGNRVSLTNARGQTIRFGYDAANRLIQVTYPDNSSVQLTRDENGNVTRMADSLGTSVYAYDTLNRLTSQTDPFGKTIGYQYDENGNLLVLTYPDGKQVAYQYDAASRMTSLTDWSGKTTLFQYDSTSLLKQVNYPNGVVTTMTYDNAGRLTAKSDLGISSYGLVLDQNGNRKQVSVSQLLANRLQDTTQTHTYDNANRILNAGSITFTSDSDGNLTSKSEGGITTSYAYDFENRLVSVSGAAQYFYNGDGVRLQSIQGGKATRYVVDTNRELSRVLCETDGNGAITSYYVYGLGLAYKVNPDGTHYYYSFDPLGSTIAMTNDARSVVNSYAYDAFGKVTNSVEGASNPFQFAGQFGIADEGNGLMYMRARYYLASLGRFLNKDRLLGDISDPRTLNEYVYALNDPLERLDLTGDSPIDVRRLGVAQILKGLGQSAYAGISTFAGGLEGGSRLLAGDELGGAVTVARSFFSGSDNLYEGAQKVSIGLVNVVLGGKGQVYYPKDRNSFLINRIPGVEKAKVTLDMFGFFFDVADLVGPNPPIKTPADVTNKQLIDLLRKFALVDSYWNDFLLLRGLANPK